MFQSNSQDLFISLEVRVSTFKIWHKEQKDQLLTELWSQTFQVSRKTQPRHLVVIRENILIPLVSRRKAHDGQASGKAASDVLGENGTPLCV